MLFRHGTRRTIAPNPMCSGPIPPLTLAAPEQTSHRLTASRTFRLAAFQETLRAENTKKSTPCPRNSSQSRNPAVEIRAKTETIASHRSEPQTQKSPPQSERLFLTPLSPPTALTPL